MSKKFKLIYCSLFAVFAIICSNFDSFAAEKELSQAPQGYSWKRCENIRASFLFPEGWFFKEEEREGTRAVFITKESIEVEGMYKTGFSANVIQNALEKTGMLPSEYARQVIDSLKSMTQSQGIREVGDGVIFKGYGGFFRSELKELGNIVQYTLVMGNDKTSTVYIFIFESPEAEWEQALKTGTPIIDNLALDPEF